MQVSQAEPHGERIARLEARLDSFALDFQNLERGQQEILKELQRYKGAVGAATFLVSALIAALSLGKDWLIAHWR